LSDKIILISKACPLGQAFFYEEKTYE